MSGKWPVSTTSVRCLAPDNPLRKQTANAWRRMRQIRVLWTSVCRSPLRVACFCRIGYHSSLVFEFGGDCRNQVGLPLYPLTKSQVKWHLFPLVLKVPWP